MGAMGVVVAGVAVVAACLLSPVRAAILLDNLDGGGSAALNIPITTVKGYAMVPADGLRATLTSVTFAPYNNNASNSNTANFTVKLWRMGAGTFPTAAVMAETTVTATMRSSFGYTPLTLPLPADTFFCDGPSVRCGITITCNTSFGWMEPNPTTKAPSPGTSINYIAFLGSVDGGASWFTPVANYYVQMRVEGTLATAPSPSVTPSATATRTAVATRTPMPPGQLTVLDNTDRQGVPASGTSMSMSTNYLGHSFGVATGANVSLAAMDALVIAVGGSNATITALLLCGNAAGVLPTQVASCQLPVTLPADPTTYTTLDFAGAGCGFQAAGADAPYWAVVLTSATADINVLWKQGSPATPPTSGLPGIVAYGGYVWSNDGGASYVLLTSGYLTVWLRGNYTLAPTPTPSVTSSATPSATGTPSLTPSASSSSSMAATPSRTPSSSMVLPSRSATPAGVPSATPSASAYPTTAVNLVTFSQSLVNVDCAILTTLWSTYVQQAAADYVALANSTAGVPLLPAWVHLEQVVFGSNCRVEVAIAVAVVSLATGARNATADALALAAGLQSAFSASVTAGTGSALMPSSLATLVAASAPGSTASVSFGSASVTLSPVPSAGGGGGGSSSNGSSEAPASSGLNTGGIAGIAAVAIVVVVALGAVVWYRQRGGGSAGARGGKGTVPSRGGVHEMAAVNPMQKATASAPAAKEGWPPTSPFTASHAI